MNLERRAQEESQRPGDINEHLQRIKEIASECSTACELGAGRTSGSLCSIAAGLLKAEVGKRRLYYCNPDEFDIGFVVQQCVMNDIPIKIYQNNIFTLEFDESIEMLMIDSNHFYGQMLLELNKIGKNTKKYIVLHDTFIDRDISSCIRCGENTKEIAKKYNLKRFDVERGVRPAIDKFLSENPEWKIKEEHTNNNGLMIIERTNLYDAEAIMYLNV